MLRLGGGPVAGLEIGLFPIGPENVADRDWVQSHVSGDVGGPVAQLHPGSPDLLVPLMLRTSGSEQSCQ
jgi:hypothetical protein